MSISNRIVPFVNSLWNGWIAVPDRAVLDRGDDGGSGLDVGVEHRVYAVQRTSVGALGLGAPPRRVGGEVVRVVAHARDLGYPRVQRVDERARYHVELVVLGKRD